jgi:ribosomal-protein-alanine N-acetyltransferase
VRELHADLSARHYPYWRPGVTQTFWGTPRLKLLDPFGNQLNLCEPKKDEPTAT